jgi:hypothetical protein
MFTPLSEDKKKMIYGSLHSVSNSKSKVSRNTIDPTDMETLIPFTREPALSIPRKKLELYKDVEI